MLYVRWYVASQSPEWYLAIKRYLYSRSHFITSLKGCSECRVNKRHHQDVFVGMLLSNILMAYQASCQKVHNCNESLNFTVLVRGKYLPSIFSGVAASQILGEGNTVSRSKISNSPRSTIKAWRFYSFSCCVSHLLTWWSQLTATNRLKHKYCGRAGAQAKYCWVHLRPSPSLSGYSTVSSTMLIGCTDNKMKSRIADVLQTSILLFFCCLCCCFRYCQINVVPAAVWHVYSEGQMSYPSWVLGV